MATLTSNITADVKEFIVTGDVSAAVRRGYYRLEDEIIQLRSFALLNPEQAGYADPARRGPDDRNHWVVVRGSSGSVAASHVAGTEILGASDAFVAGDALPAPTPFASGGDIAEQTILSITVPLTDAQIKALPTTAIELVPAPGADKIIVPIAGFVILDTTAGLYVASGDASWQLLLGSQEFSGLLQPTIFTTDAGILFFWFPLPFMGTGAGPAAGYLVTSGETGAGVINQPVRIKDDYNGVADYTGGNAANSMTVTVLYTIVDMT
jgi:hypothetical protein